MTEIYKQNLKMGLEFQDYVVEKLYDIGLPIISYSSKKFQYLIGENKCGFEIKYDRLFRKTGNIYIEIAEKSNKDNLNYIDSGIYRADNTWLYIIGDYTTIYILPKKLLKIAHTKNKYREVTTLTSKGFLIPITDIEDFYSIKTIQT
jgi:hypothetical protein